MTTSNPTAETLATVASRLASLEQLPRELRLPLAHVLREAGAGLRRGMPLPIRLHAALGELVAGLDEFTERPADPIDSP